MNESIKLHEAKYFYSRMVKENGNRDNFKCELSAFLSAARSVLQYALKEAETKNGGQRWYDSCIQIRPVLKFFKDKRDVNIHSQPISPSAHYELAIKETIHISDSIMVKLMDKDGNIKQQYSSAEEKQPNKTETSSLKITYKFNDWLGNEDVTTLCKMYILELEIVITDGIQKGFITA